LSYLLDAVPSEGLEAAEVIGDDGSRDVSAKAVDLIPRLVHITALSTEIAGLARKRIAALARGKELSRRERRRLDELLSRALADIAACICSRTGFRILWQRSTPTPGVYAGRSESCCSWPKAAASHARR
jgi:hypothetical protein